MTANEKELISLIRENDNQEEAITTAVSIILSVLEQHESYQAPTVASLQAQA